MAEVRFLAAPGGRTDIRYQRRRLRQARHHGSKPENSTAYAEAALRARRQVVGYSGWLRANAKLFASKPASLYEPLIASIGRSRRPRQNATKTAAPATSSRCRRSTANISISIEAISIGLDQMQRNFKPMVEQVDLAGGLTARLRLGRCNVGLLCRWGGLFRCLLSWLRQPTA